MENLTLETFKKKIMNFETNTFQGELPTIIDFSADSWCAPCKVLSPILKELAEEYKDKINIYKIDVEEEIELSTIFNIKSIPTMIFYKIDGESKTINGVLPKSKLEISIKDFLNV